MSAVQIFPDRGNEVTEQLRSGRASLMERPAVPATGAAASAELADALATAGRISTTLVDLTAMASTLTALAITNAILDAERADR